MAQWTLFWTSIAFFVAAMTAVAVGCFLGTEEADATPMRGSPRRRQAAAQAAAAASPVRGRGRKRAGEEVTR